MNDELGTMKKEGGAVRPSSSFIIHHSSFAPAFTLTEVLIVIGIIVMMLALAVPAFNFITGARSQAGAENVISAMLGRARQYAIQNQTEAGVAFFVEPSNQRTTMALVVRGITNGSSPEDPYYNYRGWTNQNWTSPSMATNPTYYSPAQNPYRNGHEVIWPVPDNTENKVLVERFIHDSSGTSATPAPPNSPPWTGAGAGGTGTYVDFIPDADFQTLPPGVGCQLINDPKDIVGGTNADRYVRTGVIMFDAQGRVESAPLAFALGSSLGNKLQLAADTPALTVRFFSQLGLVLYDREAFVNQSGATEYDPVLNIPSLEPGAAHNYAFSANEAQEEQWLDANATPLYLDRYNGTVLKGE